MEQPVPLFLGDNTLLKFRSHLSKDKWLRSLNNFFSMIEKELALEVIVLAHPKSNHTRKKNFYQNRKIIDLEKLSFIHNCQFVMHRLSTAFDYAVLFKKPSIILVGREDIETNISDFYTQAKFFQEKTKSSLVNIDEKFDKQKFSKDLKVSVHKYSYHKKKIILIPNKTNNEIILDKIKNNIYFKQND